MTETTFFRLLDGADRPARLLDAVKNLREGGNTPDVHHADPDSFRQVPGSPFAYWVSEEMRGKFVELPLLETKERTAKRGPSTGDDFRRIRLWWEPHAKEVVAAGGWVHFSKGGEYSPYYADIHLLVAWDRNRRTFLDFHGRSGRMTERPESLDYFFRPGLTWPRRTTSGISVRVLPAGCIFADKGPAAFSSSTEPLTLLALMNSRVFGELVALHMGAAHTAARSYEVGVIQRTPIPDIPAAESERLGELALECVEMKRGLDSANETSHAFHLPALLRVEGDTLADRTAAWGERVSGVERGIAENQREIDDLAFDLYGIADEDRAAMEGAENTGGADGEGEAEESPEVPAPVDGASLVADLLSYAVGCAFGRWDVRIALDPSLAPKLADPFAPLPVCSPGTLTGPDAMPVRLGSSGGEAASEAWMRARPDAATTPKEGSVESPAIPNSDLPLDIDRDGILADDPARPDDDIVCRVRAVLESLWGEDADDIEREACDVLGATDLRACFRNPKKFFDHHIKRYSKSRRKAPIYWLLQSPKKNYALWIYYHRLDPDLLFKALTRYVEPRIRYEETRLEESESRLRELTPEGGREAKKAERTVAAHRDLLADLREFRARLSRAADLSLDPDLDDGVVLNAAPLHEVVPWPEAKARWNELLSGKHEWSSIARHLREKGVV